MATAPKYYFFDCGVLNALRGELSLALKPSSYRYGKLFETLVINQLLAANDYLEAELKPYFWRTQSGAEIDLILARGPGSSPRAIEIKSEQTPELNTLRALQSFKVEYPEAKLFCLCNTTSAYMLEDIVVLPWREGIRSVFDVK